MNLFAFPFYNAIEKQARFTAACQGSGGFALAAPNDRFLPFQITKPADGQLIDCIKVFNLSGGLIFKVEPEDVEYQMFTNGINDFVFYYGAIIPEMNLALCTPYYLQVGGYFSEVFTVADVSKLIAFNWQHSTNVGAVVYQSGFLQRLYLDTVISEPTYPTTIEEDENGFGENIPTLTTVAKRYILDTDLLPEYLVDVLASLPLHDSVNIGLHQRVKSIQAEPEWLIPGCMAKIELQFNEAELNISKTCETATPLIEVQQEGYQPKGWLCGDNSDTTPYWQTTGETRCVQVEAPVRETAWRGIDPYCET